MKLGTQTASLVNHLMAGSFGTTDIKIGETGATILSWTDRHPCTVIEKFKVGKFWYIEVQQDRAVRIDENGMSDSQKWEYSRDTTGIINTFRITENGYQHVRKNENGRYVKATGYGLSVGRREKFHDFSF